MDKEQTVYDAIILGSGPGGDTAGIYLARSGYKSIILQGDEPGGQLSMAPEVENYPGFEKGIKGYELMDKMFKQAQNLGVESCYETAVSADFSSRPFKINTQSGKVLLCKNLIIGTGAGAKFLGLPSEKRYIGKGVSVCATCDGNFFRKKTVAVIGGGRTAGIEALYLAKIAAKVYIIYRKDKLFRIEKAVLDKITSTPNIEIIYNSEVTEILGVENPTKVSGVTIKNNKTNETKKLELNGIFIAIGKSPRTEIFKDSGLELDEKGYIVTKPDTCRTNIKHVYAVGDVNNKPIKQAIIAASHGCMAAMELEEDEE